MISKDLLGLGTTLKIRYENNTGLGNVNSSPAAVNS